MGVCVCAVASTYIIPTWMAIGGATAVVSWLKCGNISQAIKLTREGAEILERQMHEAALATADGLQQLRDQHGAKSWNKEKSKLFMKTFSTKAMDIIQEIESDAAKAKAKAKSALNGSLAEEVSEYSKSLKQAKATVKESLDIAKKLKMPAENILLKLCWK